jgi:asparagine synthetase B (glutamine-hydrolysing)
MFPGRTVMDLVCILSLPRASILLIQSQSLAMALYFASKGEGTVRRIPDVPPEPYASSARILLSGLGSDELLGGYGRYRTAYIASGWKAVIEEVTTNDYILCDVILITDWKLQLDLDRIPTRNLGRDDRVISSHGKETRHPFLSISFVNFVSELPVHFKVDPRLEVGLGDKLLLRLAARKLGLLEVSRRKKRAMQFGSHSARMQPGEADRHGDLALP